MHAALPKPNQTRRPGAAGAPPQGSALRLATPCLSAPSWPWAASATGRKMATACCKMDAYLAGASFCKETKAEQRAVIQVAVTHVRNALDACASQRMRIALHLLAAITCKCACSLAASYPNPSTPQCTRTERPWRQQGSPGQSGAQRRREPTRGAQRGSPQRQKQWWTPRWRPQPGSTETRDSMGHGDLHGRADETAQSIDVVEGGWMTGEVAGKVLRCH